MRERHRKGRAKTGTFGFKDSSQADKGNGKDRFYSARNTRVLNKVVRINEPRGSEYDRLKKR